jgi:hypothetical protein
MCFILHFCAISICGYDMGCLGALIVALGVEIHQLCHCPMSILLYLGHSKGNYNQALI